MRPLLRMQERAGNPFTSGGSFEPSGEKRRETVHGRRPGNFNQEKSDTSFLILLKITDNLCADGLVFDETSIQFAKCSFPFSVDCSDRPQLQKAKSSGVCPRKNGYFPHENPEVPIALSNSLSTYYVRNVRRDNFSKTPLKV